MTLSRILLLFALIFGKFN